MLPFAINLLALLLYLIASACQLALIRKQLKQPLLQKQRLQSPFPLPPSQRRLLAIVALAILAHGAGIYALMDRPEGMDLGIVNMASLVMLVINLLVLLSSLHKPLHNLFILLLPLSAIAIAMPLFVQQPHFITAGSGVKAHILLSLVAYSLLAIASLQAVLLGWQNHQLRHHRLTGFVKLLPPLQTMEQLLFELLWIGVLLLGLGIISGFFYLDDIFSQQLAHKTVLSIIAWLVFAGLLWGRHRLGWRANVAIKWVLTGFCLLMLAYFGSKLVLEVIL